VEACLFDAKAKKAEEIKVTHPDPRPVQKPSHRIMDARRAKERERKPHGTIAVDTLEPAIAEVLDDLHERLLALEIQDASCSQKHQEVSKWLSDLESRQSPPLDVSTSLSRTQEELRSSCLAPPSGFEMAVMSPPDASPVDASRPDHFGDANEMVAPPAPSIDPTQPVVPKSRGELRVGMVVNAEALGVDGAIKIFRPGDRVEHNIDPPPPYTLTFTGELPEPWLDQHDETWEGKSGTFTITHLVPDAPTPSPDGGEDVELLQKLDQYGATGTDMSPGDQHCKDAAARIRLLKSETSRLKGELTTLRRNYERLESAYLIRVLDPNSPPRRPRSRR
jgi:hypothetical protein